MKPKISYIEIRKRIETVVRDNGRILNYGKCYSTCGICRKQSKSLIIVVMETLHIIQLCGVCFKKLDCQELHNDYLEVLRDN